MQPKHPAARAADLPEEVRDYIGRIELELYDKKQESAASQAIFLGAIGAALLFINYKGYFGAPSIWAYAGAVMFLVLACIFYWYQWRKNAEEFLPSDAPCSVTDEAIRQEWELNYLTQSRAERDASFNGS
jgi:hypothetical protein